MGYSTSEDGTSFFSFQSTSFNSFGHSTDNETDGETEDNTEEPVDGDTLVEETISDEKPSQKEYEDIEEEREELEENIPLSENKRTARSPNDPFDQQKDILSSLNPQHNEISNNPLRTNRERIPVYPAVSLHGDTLVNDLLFNNGRRGGLIRLEPDAELLDKD